MRRETLEKIFAFAAVAVAIALLAAGGLRQHKVYDADTEAYGIVAFIKLRDLEMVVDATFGGVTRQGDRLYSTYDRSEPRTKRACPT